jgi:hypothetical protein
MGGDGRGWEEVGGDGRRWEDTGGDGRRWEEMGGDGRRWERLTRDEQIESLSVVSLLYDHVALERLKRVEGEGERVEFET